MFKMKAEYDFSEQGKEVINLDINSNTLEFNKGSYEELYIKLTSDQLFELYKDLSQYYLDELLEYEEKIKKELLRAQNK